MDKPNNSTILNICIIPEDHVGNMSINISQSLETKDTLFTLDGKRFFPHMTAFMARFPDNKINEVINRVQRALLAIKPFRCDHSGYFMTAGRYLEASYRKTNEFMKLHDTLIDNVADLRINPGNPYEESYFAPYTPEQQVNAQETGYDLARDLYRPHITLTRYREGGLPKTFPALPAANLSFNLTKVCVYKADDNGAVYELLKEFAV